MIPEAGEQPLLTVDQLLDAEPQWPFGRSGTYAAIQRGELPSVRIGRRLFIPTQPLRQLLGLDGMSVPAVARSGAPARQAETPIPDSIAAPDRQVRRPHGIYTSRGAT